MPTTSLAQQILARPDAALQMRTIQTALDAERQRRQEFYEWVTESLKAEFINGDIVIHSPVKKRHWNVTDLLSSLLSFYVRIKKIGRVGVEKVMIALTRNDYEPDLVFFSTEKADLFTDDQVLFPAPDFVVEILSKSTSAADRKLKKADYAAHGVQEYWIIDPVKQSVEQYVLATGATEYFPAKTYQVHDSIASVAIAGFEIPVLALFDEAANVAALQRLLA